MQAEKLITVCIKFLMLYTNCHNILNHIYLPFRGSGGPGGTDSYHWQCFLLYYGADSSNLRKAVTNLALYLSNGVVDWMSIRALMANRLVALDKCPGVCPIGVGECLRRVLGHVMGLVTG